MNQPYYCGTCFTPIREKAGEKLKVSNSITYFLLVIALQVRSYTGICFKNRPEKPIALTPNLYGSDSACCTPMTD